MFGNLGMGELMVILVIVLVLFGAKRVPEISASFGQGIREFKRNLHDIEDSITTAQPQREIRPSTAYAPSNARPVAEERPEPKRLL